ncbi:hypothetical protein C474_20174 [Halogeometricum pallidum JCM 14848]|uniref:DUF7960 domain-containing protein n=1 Tax=Halogeometricum pallidum JCM 14848 TaxID=1227487 RepID=M0CTI4_HALPD|nr:hypothetical protein [Halogeometricum pallidum]ELZ26501.1 hypothetical protein C474_20174 [Halogeometricum pallidum JCM 14848]
MYTGKTEQPCCLCDDRDTVARIDVPPRAVPLMKHSGSVAWRDIVGEVSIHFCESDWDLVTDLVAMGLNPLSRCNVARASFSIREDFEALLNATRDAPDQRAQEAGFLDEARETLDDYGEDPMVEERDFVEAWVVVDSLSES